MTPTNRQSLITRLTSLNTWRRADVRAPHKPLLLLTILARLSRGESGEVRYADIHQPLHGLLREYGPARKSYHPEFPFWHLQSDGIWTLSDTDQLTPRAGSSSPTVTSLRQVNPTGRLAPDLEQALTADPTLLAEVVQTLLNDNFPDSVHAEILTEVGMAPLDQLTTTVRRRPRDPAFREKILRAYERRCAVCGYDVCLGGHAVALDAAHIKWHQAGGPDREPNGLALCAMHHRLFDRGAFTLTSERRVVVSQDTSGGDGLGEVLLRYHGEPTKKPQTDEYLADLDFIAWHTREVFRGPERSPR